MFRGDAGRELAPATPPPRQKWGSWLQPQPEMVASADTAECRCHRDGDAALLLASAVLAAGCCKQTETLMQIQHPPASTSSQTGSAACVGTATARAAATSSAAGICRETLESGSELIDRALCCSALVLSLRSSRTEGRGQNLHRGAGNEQNPAQASLAECILRGIQPNKRWLALCLPEGHLFKTTASHKRCSCSITNMPGHCLNT